MRMIRNGLAFLLLIGVAATAQEAPAPHPFNVHDMLAMQRIAGEKASPDGKWMAFTLRTTDLQANRGRTDIWLVGTDGRGLRQLTSDPAADSDPAWAPDSKTVYFLSTRSGSAQVWKVPIGGGDALAVTKLPLDVGSFIVSPDGTRLALSMEVFPGLCPAGTARRLEETAKRPATGRLYDRLFFRHWDTWKDGRRAHLFVVPLAGGEAVDVMKEMDADCPVKPFGGSTDFTFTPDSRALVFTAADNGREEAWTTNQDLFLVPCDGSAAPRNLTADNPAREGNPVFSHDGRTLGWLAMKRPGFEADRLRIMLRPWPTGATRVLAESWDRSADTIVWSSDDRTIYTTAGHLGQNAIFAIDVARETVKTVVGDGTVTSVGLAGPRLVYGRHSLLGPTELFSVDRLGRNPRPLTAINGERLKGIQLGQPEQFTFAGWNGEQVYGYVVRPVGFDPQKKYPIAFLIHGGPQGSFGNDFHYRWNPQTYAAAGYAALMIDFHGSTGYGQAFTDSISNDWGGKPLEDLQKGLAAALQKYPWMDGERVAALGASYGGYMINWIAGKWPDRFRCLVVHDGNLDEQMAYFDTEELWFPEWEHGGTPWENPDAYQKHNPVNLVKNWRTPTLVVHGGQDFRVVDTQGMSTFTALQRRGIPSRLLYFPDENHWVLKPANSILWHETVLAWLDQWTKK